MDEGETVNLQHLKTFVAVVEAGSFSAAARALGISQPAVTQHIKALELEVGATLIERRYRRVALTEAGTVLLPVARKVLTELDDVRENIASIEHEVSGQLVIGASTTPGVYLLPHVLGDFIAMHPHVNITLCISDSVLVAERVASGEVNLGMTGAIVRGVPVEFEQLGVDELVAIGPLSSPLADKHSSLTDFAEQPFVMRERGSGTRQVAEKVLRDRGVDADELRVAVELGTGEAIVGAVEGGLGVSIVSRLVADRAARLGTLSVLNVDGFPAERPFYAVTPRTKLTRAASAFLEHLKGRLAE